MRIKLFNNFCFEMLSNYDHFGLDDLYWDILNLDEDNWINHKSKYVPKYRDIDYKEFIRELLIGHLIIFPCLDCNEFHTGTVNDIWFDESEWMPLAWVLVRDISTDSKSKHDTTTAFGVPHDYIESRLKDTKDYYPISNYSWITNISPKPDSPRLLELMKILKKHNIEKRFGL